MFKSGILSHKQLASNILSRAVVCFVLPFAFVSYLSVTDNVCVSHIFHNGRDNNICLSCKLKGTGSYMFHCVVYLNPHTLLITVPLSVNY